MPKILRKFLMVLSGLGAGAFLFFLGKDFFFGQGITEEFSFYHWLISGAVEVLEVFLPLFLTALVVAFSYFVKTDDLPKVKGQGMSPSKTVFSAFIPVALGIMANSLIVLSVLPALEDQTYRFHFLNDMMNRLEVNLDRDRNKVNAGVDYFKHFEPGETAESRYFVIPVSERIDHLTKRLLTLEQLLAIKPENYFYTIEFAKTKIAKREMEFLRSRTLIPWDKSMEEMGQWTLEKLIEEGEEFLKESEPTRANMAASLTLKGLFNLEEGTAQEKKEFDRNKVHYLGIKDRARALLDTSWLAAKTMDHTPSEKEKASYFFRKGKSLGDFQFGNYLEAYYGFLELNREDPGDKEVQKYLAISRVETEKSVVFKEVADEYFGLGGFQDIVFINPQPEDGPGAPYELVRIGQMVETQNGTYIKDMEVTAFSSKTGQPIPDRHFIAPYGRIDPEQKTSRILTVEMEARELNKPNSDYLPRKVSEDKKAAQLYDLGTQSAMTHTLRASLGDLELVSNLDRSFEGLDLGSLFSQAQTLKSLGHTSVPLETEFLSRILNSLEMFALGFWALFVAWVLRSKVSKTKWVPVALLMTILPWVIWFLVEFFHWVARLSAAMLIQVLGIWIALGVLVALVIPVGIAGVYLFWKKLSV